MPVESDTPVGKQPEPEEKSGTEEREVPKNRKKIVCEFCECDLFPNGELKSKSERAKRMEFAEEAVEEMKKPAVNEKGKSEHVEKKSLTDGTIVW